MQNIQNHRKSDTIIPLTEDILLTVDPMAGPVAVSKVSYWDASLEMRYHKFDQETPSHIADIGDNQHLRVLGQFVRN